MTLVECTQQILIWVLDAFFHSRRSLLTVSLWFTDLSKITQESYPDLQKVSLIDSRQSKNGRNQIVQGHRHQNPISLATRHVIRTS